MDLIPTKKKKAAARKAPAPYKTCISCPSGHENQPLKNFYISYNPLHADGHVPLCKNCVVRLSYNNEVDDVDVQKFKDVLRQIDRPFIPALWDAAIKQYNDRYTDRAVKHGNRKSIISFYFKNIASLPQYRTMNWSDGLSIAMRSGNERKIESGAGANVVSSTTSSLEYIPTEEDKELFGEGFSPEVYRRMNIKFAGLKSSYPSYTPFHEEALKTYVRLKVQEEMAIARGDAKIAKDWSEAARAAATDAKINPSKLKKEDLEGGIGTFCELYQAIEQAVDVIPVLPRFRQRPYDAIDFTIWCYVNYIRDLEGKPLCSYEDVYKFYDERKEEFIARFGDPTGIFTNDESSLRRESVQQFITLPNDYYDQGAEEEDDEQ